MADDIRLHEEAATEPLRLWLPADLLDNAARTISENKTIMLGLPALDGDPAEHRGRAHGTHAARPRVRRKTESAPGPHRAKYKRILRLPLVR